jgi:protease-4
VFCVLPTFEASLAKIGITTDGVKTTPLSGQPDLLGGTSPEFDRLAQTGVEDIYGRFVGLVAASRKIAPTRVNEIGQGRVWDGGSARQLGLVDAFGGLDDAIAEAARRAKVSKPSLVYLEKGPSWLEQLASDWSRPDNDGQEDGTDMLSRLAAKQRALAWTAIDDARMLARGASIQARCLECGSALPPRAPDQSFGRWLIELLAR